MGAATLNHAKSAQRYSTTKQPKTVEPKDLVDKPMTSIKHALTKSTAAATAQARTEREHRRPESAHVNKASAAANKNYMLSQNQVKHSSA